MKKKNDPYRRHYLRLMLIITQDIYLYPAIPVYGHEVPDVLLYAPALRFENIRYATFRNLPRPQRQAWPLRLAADGYFYSGGQTPVCYYCGSHCPIHQNGCQRQRYNVAFYERPEQFQDENGAALLEMVHNGNVRLRGPVRQEQAEDHAVGLQQIVDYGQLHLRERNTNNDSRVNAHPMTATMQNADVMMHGIGVARGSHGGAQSAAQLSAPSTTATTATPAAQPLALQQPPQTSTTSVGPSTAGRGSLPAVIAFCSGGISVI